MDTPSRPHPTSMRIHRLVLLCLVAAAFLLGGCRHSAASRPGALSWRWTPIDGDGREEVGHSGPTDRAVVLAFLGTECPIAQRMLPELDRLQRELGPRGVRFLAIYPNAGETREGIQQQRRRAGLAGEAGFDPGQRLVDRWQVTVTPEVVALAADGSLIYRGRVNDQYAALGKGRPAATRHDLREALEAFLATGSPEGRRTDPVGCRILRTP